MRFKTGALYMTAGVDTYLHKNRKFAEFVNRSWVRYTAQDWGNIPRSDKLMNDNAVINNDDRIVARYNYDGNDDIYIITEWDRSVTTILFTYEY